MYPLPAPRACCARTPTSGQLVPAARIDGAECARAVQVRRRRRRCSAPRGATGAECGASACGLTVDAQGGGQQAAAAAAAAAEATCARHRRHATVSSASLRSPRGRAPSGASVHTGSMPPASPTPSSPRRLPAWSACVRDPQRLPRTSLRYGCVQYCENFITGIRIETKGKAGPQPRRPPGPI